MDGHAALFCLLPCSSPQFALHCCHLQAGQVVAWVCDPMHGNTEEVSGYKTRRYDNIRAEVRWPAAWVGACCVGRVPASKQCSGQSEQSRRAGPDTIAQPSWPLPLLTCGAHSTCPQVEAFFDVHDECGSVPGGIHLEMTGEGCCCCAAMCSSAHCMRPLHAPSSSGGGLPSCCAAMCSSAHCMRPLHAPSSSGGGLPSCCTTPSCCTPAP